MKLHMSVPFPEEGGGGGRSGRMARAGRHHLKFHSSPSHSVLAYIVVVDL